MNRRIFRWGIIGLLWVAIVFLFPSCKVTMPEGVAPGTWYINDGKEMAIKFETAKSGEFIPLTNAIASPKSFKINHRRNTLRLRLPGQPDLKGRIKVFDDRFSFITPEQSIEFRQYYTRVFPQPP